MKLFEQGKIRIDDPVTRYLPEFQGGKSDITIRDLMTHFSGLPPDLDLDPPWSGYETGIHRALIDKPDGPPGVRFVYSDINFELLGEIVRRLSGKPLDEFAREANFRAAGDAGDAIPSARRLRSSASRPPRSIRRPARRFAAWCTIPPRATWAASRATRACSPPRPILSKFAEMMLGSASCTVFDFSRRSPCGNSPRPTSPPDQPMLRGLGWDIDSTYSSQSRRTCFRSAPTATPASPARRSGSIRRRKSYVILLTNAVHPKRGQESNRAAQPRRDHRGRGVRRGCAGRQRDRLQRNARSRACGG